MKWVMERIIVADIRRLMSAWHWHLVVHVSRPFLCVIWSLKIWKLIVCVVSYRSAVAAAVCNSYLFWLHENVDSHSVCCDNCLWGNNCLVCNPTIRQLGFSTSLGNSGLCWTIFTRNRDTAVPAEGNGDFSSMRGRQQLSCPVLRPPSGPNARPQDNIHLT